LTGKVPGDIITSRCFGIVDVWVPLPWSKSGEAIKAVDGLALLSKTKKKSNLFSEAKRRANNQSGDSQMSRDEKSQE
jgi:hypothetical protein